MELCSDNLKNIIEQKRECFQRQDFEAMNSIEFYISCHLFKELLECVGYLHESNPPIIHRDLKPENVLISRESQSGHFVKLCDFGLAIDHLLDNSMTHTAGVGTRLYMAPEVRSFKGNSTRYNSKADIYSLGIIAQYLFDHDIQS